MFRKLKTETSTHPILLDGLNSVVPATVMAEPFVPHNLLAIYFCFRIVVRRVHSAIKKKKKTVTFVVFDRMEQDHSHQMYFWEIGYLGFLKF